MNNQLHQTGNDHEQTSGSGFNFHDPNFVEWWLKSLYLLPPEMQINAATWLKSVVHVPEVHAEVDLFNARFGAGPLAASDQVLPGAPHEQPTKTEEGTWFEVATASLQKLWRERPSMIWLAGLAVAVLVIRGVGAIGRIFS